VWDMPGDAGAADKLKDVPPGADVDMEGQGEILRIEEKPAHGTRDLTIDADSHLITDEVFQNLPEPYRVSRFGYSPNKVALTFDDGPWPTTPSVLKALADECTKAVFFPIGKHATYHPEILKQVAAAGHTIGAHTWSHANLNSQKLSEQQARDEIEKGFSAVKLALGAPPSPFFRFPQLQHGPAAVAYLGSRNVAIFSCDVDPFDFKAKDATQIINTVMTKIEKSGKGIILMHDFQRHTAEALPLLLRRLKAGGYKVVQMKAKAPLQTLPEYDEALVQDMKLPVASTRPVNNVVQTVSE